MARLKALTDPKEWLSSAPGKASSHSAAPAAAHPSHIFHSPTGEQLTQELYTYHRGKILPLPRWRTGLL